MHSGGVSNLPESTPISLLLEISLEMQDRKLKNTASGGKNSLWQFTSTENTTLVTIIRWFGSIPTIPEQSMQTWALAEIEVNAKEVPPASSFSWLLSPGWTCWFQGSISFPLCDPGGRTVLLSWYPLYLGILYCTHSLFHLWVSGNNLICLILTMYFV